MNKPIRKTAVPTLTSITGPSRANTNIIGLTKLSGHYSVSRNVTNIQQGATKCIILTIIS